MLSENISKLELCSALDFRFRYYAGGGIRTLKKMANSLLFTSLKFQCEKKIFILIMIPANPLPLKHEYKLWNSIERLYHALLVSFKD